MDKKTTIYRFDDWLIEPHLNHVRRDEEVKQLEPLAMDVLAYLLENAGEVVAADELLDRFWPDRHAEPSMVTRCIRQIRRALGDDAKDPVYIETITKRGYRTIAPVSPGPRNDEISAMDREQSAPKDELAEPLPNSNWYTASVALRRAALGGVVVALIAAGAWLALKGSFVPDSHSDSENLVQWLPNSIGVLPFRNLSPDPKHAFFADGIHEEVIFNLAKIPTINVISSTSMRTFADSEMSVPEIGSSLNVAVVLEGSVRFADERVRISLNLIDAVSDKTLWSQSYNREFIHIFEIQSEIAGNVASAMHIRLNPDNNPLLVEPATTSPVAYKLWLQLNNVLRAQGMRAAKAVVDEILEIDPEFARAYASLAFLDVFSAMGNYDLGSEPIQEVFDRAFANARIADEIDPALNSEYEVQAAFLASSWRWRELNQHLASPPNGYENPGLLGLYHWLLGNHNHALDLKKQALDIDPKNPERYAQLARSYNALGRFEQQARHYRQALELGPTDWFYPVLVAGAERDLGNHDEAKLFLDQADVGLSFFSPRPTLIATVCYEYGRLGYSERANEEFQKLLQFEEEGGRVGGATWVIASLGIADRERVAYWLKQTALTVEQGELIHGFFQVNIIASNLLHDPVLEEAEFLELRKGLIPDL